MPLGPSSSAKSLIALPLGRPGCKFSYAVFLSGGVSLRHVTPPVHRVDYVGEPRHPGMCLMAGRCDL
jgi:hypothetical protein